MIVLLSCLILYFIIHSKVKSVCTLPENVFHHFICASYIKPVETALPVCYLSNCDTVPYIKKRECEIY
ncbi:hypothetical protein CHK_3095 [Christensenella hongkongensis]|uniref:Uncharacterized protein n=1 Tax=Christensenella hongkongensis TaxID=270498 RepID=A0A0M2NGG7_9FIRM|nr:hypothetical protein CHK_3095 [Christensenella hongkongensis]